MGLGPYIYLLWFLVVLASLVIAGIHLVRRRLRGVGPALAAMAGVLMSWAFISAYIGTCEIDGYAGSSSFAVSVAIGIVGIGLFVWSCIALRRKGNRQDGETI